MSTILLLDETEDARRMSTRQAQECVDKLMEYDRNLSGPFTKEQLAELFKKEESKSGQLSVSTDLHVRRFMYLLLTEEEKHLLNELNLTPEKPPVCDFEDGLRVIQPADPAEARHILKQKVIQLPQFLGGLFSGMFGRGNTGHIYVWLDSCNYKESKYKGFYYVRYQLSMYSFGTTAYASPALVVEKKKLRQDQVDYMERKRQETQDAVKRAAEKKE